MKICKIRFKNLNSLVGEWEIDLTNPVFVSDGLFAITGPTGAGKSTILDAICLGLYGRTPRLDVISESTNEILARGTSECFAEVTFQTAEGMFVSHWSQRRAKQRVDGKLQPSKHEIALVKSKKLIAEKKKDVKVAIQKITGMEYGQFTRSMLLAQGDFAAFLQAKLPERTAILEQITGTEFYSEISIAAHERCAQEKKELERLRYQLQAGDTFLSELEVNELKQELADKQTQAAAYQAKCEQIDSWNQLYLKVRSLRRDCVSAQSSLKQQSALLIKHQQELEQASADHNSAVQHQQTAEDNRKKFEPIYQIVCKLEDKIQDLSQSFTKLNHELITQQNTYNDNVEQQKKLHKDKRHSEKKQNEVLQKLAELSHDARLVSELSGIKVEILHIEKLRVKLDHSETLNQRKQKELKQKQAELQRRQALLEPTETELTELTQIYQAQAGKRRTLLGSAKMIELRADHQQCRERLERVKQAVVKLGELGDETAEHDVLNQCQQKVRGSREQLKHQFKELTEKLAEAKREWDMLDEQYLKQLQQQKLEDYRQSLHAGQPCPLCGSKEHPFVAHQPPVDDQLGHQREQAQQNYEAIQRQVNELDKRQTQLVSQWEQYDMAAQKSHKTIAQLQRVVDEYCVELKLELNDARGRQQQLNCMQQQLTTESTQIAQTLNAVDELDDDMEQLRSKIDKSQKKFYKIKEEQDHIEHEIDLLESSQQEIHRQYAEVQQKIRQGCHDLNQQLQPLGLEVTEDTDLSQCLTTLSDRLRTWEENQDIKQRLEDNLSKINNKQQQLADKTQRDNEELAKLHQRLRECSQELKQLQEQKTQQWSGPDVEVEHTKLLKAVEVAGQKLQKMTEVVHQVQTQSALKEQEISKLKSQIQQYHDELKREEEAGVDQLAKIKSLIITEAGDHEELEGSAQQQTQAWVQQLETAVSVESLAEDIFVVPRQNFAQQSRQLTEDMGRIRHQLAENHRKYQLLCEQKAAVDNQLKEYERWACLNELIGHSKGDKYRNFAQGITFQRMVRCANFQLKKMSDRYVLVQDTQHPLKLNVRDTHQAGEIRSVKNLSGGESFLVSLSLALGLSQMASKNVRVDSLFLDEGFGTLDEDTLEMALDALGELRQENKVIGMISHVTALKQRIPAQIQVQKAPGGRSVLRGPGCTQLSDR